MTSATPADLGPAERRANAFGLLRLVMATLVIVSHAFPIGGFGPDPTYVLFREQADVGQLAVLSFFAISGYLITRSGRSGGVGAFLWRRALRIMPAFWVVLVLTAGILGPISYAVAHQDLGGYWTASAHGPLAYVWKNSALHIANYGIDGVFSGSAYGAVAGVDAVNGSLWSLFFEALCYLGVAVAMLVGLLRGRGRRMLPVLLAMGLVIVHCRDTLAPFARIVDAVTVGNGGPDLYLAFACGAVAALFPARVRWSPLLGVGALLVTLGTLVAGGFVGIGVVALSYAVLAAAHTAPGWACRIGSVNDISYGIYIYAWPVAMLLAQVGAASAGIWPFVVATVLATVPLAAASWVVVERPALRLKHRGPGRPRRLRRGSAVRASTGPGDRDGRRRRSGPVLG